jgi:hypothetical protein
MATCVIKWRAINNAIREPLRGVDRRAFMLADAAFECQSLKTRAAFC